MLKASVGDLDSQSVQSNRPAVSTRDFKGARRTAAWVVLFVGLTVTVAVALSWRSAVQADNQRAFNASAREVAANLDTLLKRDVDLVESARAYYKMHPRTTPAEFLRWMNSLDAGKRYAGLDRVGLLERVPAAGLNDFEKRAMRQSRGAHFAISPPGRRSTYCLSAALATGASAFRMAPGTFFDYCQPGVYGQARDALQQSIDAGTTGIAPSFGEMIAIFTPTYRGGRAPATIAARRRDATSWTIGFFHSEQVLKAATGNSPLGARVIQTDRSGRGRLVMQGGSPPDNPALAVNVRLPGNERLTVSVSGDPKTKGLSANTQAAVIVAAGFALFGILFLLIQTLSRARERALALVESRTRELRHSEARLASIAKSSPTGIIQVDHDGSIEFANERFNELLRLNGEDQATDDWLERFGTEDRERLIAALRAPGDDRDDMELRVNGAVPRWLRVSVAPITSTDEAFDDDGAVASLEDVTVAHTARERLRYEARHDQLTGLANRARFLEQLREELDSIGDDDTELTVLYLDLDRFKPVNDVLGHAAGDELLRLVARRLRSVLRENDQLSRHGGDEFTILLHGYRDRAMVERVVDRLVETIGEPFTVADGQTVTIGVSIGVVHVADGDRSPDEILRDADIAMYRAKGGSRGFAVFDDADRQRHVAHLKTERELRAAIENNELELYYQPVINMKRGTLTGAEALIRWNHPHRGLLGPFEFLPLADATGLIVPIGEWVIDSASKFLSERPKDIRVSINVAARQLLDEGFVDRLCEISGAYGVDRSRLFIEVIESDHLVGEALEIAKEVRARGFAVGIDDFGTGYNSLLYLKSYRFDFVKIDRAFVSELSKDPAADEVFLKVVELSHALGLNVVAEGVETREQSEVVHAGGCDFGQGYLWAKPMPADAFDAFTRVFKSGDAPARKLRAI